MKIYSRGAWGARLPQKLMAEQDAPTECYIHYSYDFSVGRIDTLAEQEAKMRAIQNYHMDTNGWSDIGYAFVVFQPYGSLRRARAFQGRLTKYVPAAQAGHNTRTLPICVVAGPDDAIKRNTRYVIEQIINRYPSVKTVGGHRDVVATSCPGDKLYAQIPTIARATGRKVYKP